MYRVLTVTSLCVGLVSIAAVLVALGYAVIERFSGIQLDEQSWNYYWSTQFANNLVALPLSFYFYRTILAGKGGTSLATRWGLMAALVGILTSIAVKLFWYFGPYQLQIDLGNDPLIPSFAEVLQNVSVFSLFYVMSVIVVAPIVEEVVFRGIAFHLMKPENELQRFLVCVVPWSLLHLKIGGLYFVLSSFLGGSVYYIIRRQTGSCAYPIIAHSAFNLTSLVMG